MDTFGTAIEEFLDILFQLSGLPSLLWESGDRDGAFAALGLIALLFLAPILLGFLIGALWMARKKNKQFDRELDARDNQATSQDSRHRDSGPREGFVARISREHRERLADRDREKEERDRQRDLEKSSSRKGADTSGPSTSGSTAAPRQPADNDRTDADRSARV